MTININSSISQVMNNYQGSYAKNATTSVEETQQISDEEFSQKNTLGMQRYNFLAIDGWLDNSIFEKDENIKKDFIEHLDKMDKEEYSGLVVTFATKFLPQLTQNEDGEVVNGTSLKNPQKEFFSLHSTINFFTNEIDELINSAKKFGGNPTTALAQLTDVLKIFQNHQSKEQQNQYIALGQSQNNNG